MKNRLEIATKGMASFFSCPYRPGATNRQNCQKTTGIEMMSPTSAAILMRTKKRLCRLGVNERAALGKGLEEGHHDERFDRANDRERQHEPDKDRRDREDEPFPQLV